MFLPDRRTLRMPLRRLQAADLGVPRFHPAPAVETAVGLFDLSSHRRAREALQRGLAVQDTGFNIFLLGDNRSGRMSATLACLDDYVRAQPPPSDWVYLPNFLHPHRPAACALPAGRGRRLRARVAALVPAMRSALGKAFEAPGFASDMQRLSSTAAKRLEQAFAALQALAREHGLGLERGEQGVRIQALGEDGAVLDAEHMDDAERERANAALEAMREPLRDFNRVAARTGTELAEQIETLRRETAEQAVASLLDALDAEFGDVAGIGRWLVALRADVPEQLALLLPDAEPPPAGRRAEDRYAVNLFVDHGDDDHPPVLLEPEPDYAHLFGHVEYRMVNGVLETDASLLRAGALHRANGGVLVVRAEGIAADAEAWAALKGALRDRAVRTEDRAREGGPPLAGALTPGEIPLDLKVVVVGAPFWYYAFFTQDADFQTHFKVKADIDPDLPTTASDLATYRALLARAALDKAHRPASDEAIECLLAHSAREAGARDRLSGRIELLYDVLSEAGVIAADAGDARLEAAHVGQALEQRRRRNARLEDRTHEQITRGTLLIDTAGAVVGQVNGLTVESTGDHAFGRPVRITARTYAGRHGVLNIERVVELGGPIQQKGVYVLEGFLAGRFAQHFPLSFSASVTFEQSYGGVEGDSASMAEVVAIVSSLAGVPVRQDIAITGSMDQHGRAQAIGGVNEKIEGFFRACRERGASGSEGVIIPVANERNLVLHEEVVAAVAEGRFHVASVSDVDDAIEYLTGLPAGVADAEGHYPPGSVYARLVASLEAYDRALTRRLGGGSAPA